MTAVDPMTTDTAAMFLRQRDEACAERDRYIRAFNRLERAVTNHITRDCIDSEGLAHAHGAVMRDLTEKLR